MSTPFKIDKKQNKRGKELPEVEEEIRHGGMNLGLHKRGARKLGAVDIPPEFRDRISTGYEQVDMFLSNGGGMCPIQAISINAPRGGGKTTLWLQLLQGMFDGSQGKLQGLYGSGEEYIEQLALAAERTGCLDVSADNLTAVEDYLEEIESGKWNAVIVDSVPALKTSMRLLNGQMVRESDVTEAEWNQTTRVPKSQLEKLAVETLVAAGKRNKCVTVFVLHQTKDNKSKGDSSIEHTVDTCIHITVPSDKDYESGFPYGAKIIACDKNRFGGTGSIVAKMGRKGWDLDNLLDLAEVQAPKNEKSAPGGVRAERKVHEMKNLIAALKTFDKPVTMAELLNKVEMPDDPTAWDRHERHIKAMVKMGKAIQIGGGKGVKKPATYEIAPEK
jgi:predicted ATP-dependent serine protease